jgi:hypothetical protein
LFSEGKSCERERKKEKERERRERERKGEREEGTGRYIERVTRSGQDERKRERSEVMSERWGEGGAGGGV